MARGKNCRDSVDSWEEAVARFVRRQEMDAEVVLSAQSVSSGWSGWLPFLKAEWSYNGCHASSRPGIEQLLSRSRHEENTEAVPIYPKVPDTDKSLATVGLIDLAVLVGFLDTLEGSKSWDSDFDSIEESATESVSIATM